MSYIGTEPKDIRSFGRTKFDYTATQGQTAFTGADDDGKVLAFTVGQIEVYVNGILMDDSDFTTTGTGTVTLASAANLNDVVNVVSFESNIPDNDYVPASGGTFSGNVTHSGTVTNSGNVTVGGTLGVTGLTTLSGNANITGDTASLTLTDTSSHSANTGPGVSFFSKDSGGTSREVAKIVGESHSGSNEGNLAFQTRNGGTLETKWKVYKNGNWLPSNSAYGIYLGTTSAVDANLLDDYEEGTWTPTAATAGSLTSAQGTYTKIGNLVTLSLYISSITNTTDSGAFGVNGVPFTPVGSGTMDSNAGSLMIRYVDVGVTEEIGTNSYISGSSTQMRFYVQQAGGTYTSITHAHFNNGGVGIRAAITFRVS